MSHQQAWTRVPRASGACRSVALVQRLTACGELTEAAAATALVGLAYEWLTGWGVSLRGRMLEVRWSTRLKRSEGLCYPLRGLIVLDRKLLAESEDRLTAVLCHETAHLGVVWLYGSGCRPHGPEWARLVATAGFKPERRSAACGPNATQRISKPGSRYEHRCPVCQMVRVARRPVPRWRCAECSTVGLAGLLEITRTPSEEAGRV
jgi:predicted SprT family Zn-dependent metalloprotease